MTVNRVLEATCALLLAAAVLVAFLAVIFRYVVGSALSWSFEASLALLTYITFVGCYLALRQNSHLKVDVFVRLLPRAGQAVVFTLIQCTIIAIAVVMLYYGGRQLWLFKEQTTLVMELPSWVLYAAIPLSGLMMGIDAAIGLFAGLRRTAHVLGYTFTYEPLADTLLAPVARAEMTPTMFLIVLSAVLIVAGAFLDGIAMMFIVVPLFMPVITLLGIDPIHFGMVVVICWGIGQQTPPVGAALFITSVIARVDILSITRANLPFIGVMLVVLALVILFPDAIVMSVPRMFGF